MKSFIPMLAGFANAVASSVFSTVIAVLSFFFSCLIVFSLILFFQAKGERE